jgi:hypothetical protein
MAVMYQPHTDVRIKLRRKNGTLELEREGELTEFIRVFCADSGYDSISESRGSMWLRLVDEMSNTGPALPLARSLRGVLCEALQESDSGSLEVLNDVCGRGRVGVGWRVRDVYARKGNGSIDGWWWLGQAHAGDAGETEQVGFVGVGTRTDKAGDAGGDAPFVNGGVALVLDDRYGGKNGVAGGGLDEANEGVCDVPR